MWRTKQAGKLAKPLLNPDICAGIVDLGGVNFIV